MKEKNFNLLSRILLFHLYKANKNELVTEIRDFATNESNENMMALKNNSIPIQTENIIHTLVYYFC